MTPSVGNFVLLGFAGTASAERPEADAFLSARGFILRAVRRLWTAGMSATDGRRRGGEPGRRRGARRFVKRGRG